MVGGVGALPVGATGAGVLGAAGAVADNLGAAGVGAGAGALSCFVERSSGEVESVLGVVEAAVESALPAGSSFIILARASTLTRAATGLPSFVTTKRSLMSWLAAILSTIAEKRSLASETGKN